MGNMKLSMLSEYAYRDDEAYNKLMYAIADLAHIANGRITNKQEQEEIFSNLELAIYAVRVDGDEQEKQKQLRDKQYLLQKLVDIERPFSPESAADLILTISKLLKHENRPI